MTVAMAADDGVPAIILIRGERGVGKCHLLTWFARKATESLPDGPLITPIKEDLALTLARIGWRLAELDRKLAESIDAIRWDLESRDRNTSRVGRTQLVLGLILGIPISLLCAYIAFLVGWA